MNEYIWLFIVSIQHVNCIIMPSLAHRTKTERWLSDPVPQAQRLEFKTHGASKLNAEFDVGLS